MFIEYGTINLLNRFVPLSGTEDYARRTAIEMHRRGAEVYWRQVTLAEQLTDWEVDMMEEDADGM